MAIWDIPNICADLRITKNFQFQREILVKLKILDFWQAEGYAHQKRMDNFSLLDQINKTKDWALVQTAALVINKDIEVRLSLVR